MLNRSLRLASFVICLFSLALASFLLYSLENYAPIGATWHMAMAPGSAAPKGSFEQVNTLIEDYGAKHQVDIVRLVPDADNPRSISHLYVESSAGNSFAADWLAHGYHSFNMSRSYRVHPIGDSSDIDPSGEYLVGGSQHDVTQLQASLAKVGYTPLGFERIASPRLAIGLLNGFSMWAAPLAVAIFTLALVVVGVAMNARDYAIARLQGISLAGGALIDLFAAVRFGLRVLAAMLAISLAALGLYNHFHQLGYWLLLSLIVFACAAISAAIIHLIVLAIVWHLQLHPAIQGKAVTGWMIVAAYIVRLFTLLMLFVVSALAVTDGVGAARAQQRYDRWQGATQVGKIAVAGGTYSADGRSDNRDVSRAVGAWERSLDRRGQLLVAILNPASGGAGGADITVAGQPRDVLYVNPTYAKLQGLRDCTGAPLLPPSDPATVTVLVPATIASHTPEIVGPIQQWLAFQHDPNRAHPAITVPTHIATACAGQAWFTYNAASTDLTHWVPSVLHDLVLVVVPPQLLADAEYYAFTTQGEVLATDTHEALKAYKSNPELRNFVLGVSPAIQQAASDLVRAHTNFVTSILNCLIAVGALLASTVGLAVVYTRKHGAFIFASRICGWTYRHIFGRFFAMDALIVLFTASAMSAGLLSFVTATAGHISADADLAVTTMRQVVPVSGVATFVLVWALLVGVVVVNAKRIIVARSEDVG